MTAEEFQAWKDHPATQWVLKALNRASDLQQAAWTDASWVNGECDQIKLTELRTRADAYRAMAETEYADWCNILGEETKTEE